MRVVRAQLFPFIIRSSSQVESAHLCGGEKPLAFIHTPLHFKRMLSRLVWPSGITAHALISVGAIKILPPGNSGFLRCACCWRKGADTRTRPKKSARETWRKNHQETFTLNGGGRKRSGALFGSGLDFGQSQKASCSSAQQATCNLFSSVIVGFCWVFFFRQQSQRKAAERCRQ